MSLISRLTTWVSGQVLKAADLNGEFNNVTNLLNNLDSATTSWTNVKTTTLTPTTVTKSFAFSPTTLGIIGTTTNDSATAGNVGEYKESVFTGNTSIPGASLAWADITSLSLTAGDWMVTACAIVNINGATSGGFVDYGISSTPGNSVTGMNFGQNQLETILTTGQVSDAVLVIPPYRVSIASTTPYYWKMQMTYSAATPVTQGYRLSAWRIR